MAALDLSLAELGERVEGFLVLAPVLAHHPAVLSAAAPLICPSTIKHMASHTYKLLSRIPSRSAQIRSSRFPKNSLRTLVSSTIYKLVSIFVRNDDL